jgi:hypothetical protein
MKSFLVFIIGAVVGLAAAFFVLPGVFVGMGAGVGISTGLKAGACLTAEAAKEKGYISGEQVGELIAAAGQQISAQGVPVDQNEMASGDAKCQEIIAKLKEAAAGAK